MQYEITSNINTNHVESIFKFYNYNKFTHENAMCPLLFLQQKKSDL